MTGGMIQLVAYGKEDMFITQNPQITFFKIVYRRHTNFTFEQIPQYFPDQQANFSKQISTTLAKNGDLLGEIVVNITLPPIKYVNPLTKFAWVRRIGFAIIKNVDIQLNGILIDRHYGDWLNLWAEMMGYLTGPKKSGYAKMIGDVPELVNFTNDKSAYTLQIPLNFWFCRSSGNTIPLSSLQYTDIKINIEFNDLDMCLKVSPSNYIQCNGNIVNFLPNEYIYQTVSGSTNVGIFNYFDINLQRLYYYNITGTNTNNKITGIPSSSNQAQTQTQNQSQYKITGLTSQFNILPATNVLSKTFSTSNLLRNINLQNCFLIVTYYYLDDEERLRFMQSKHDYIIEQLFLTSQTKIDNINRTVNLTIDQTCKYLIWYVQLQYNINSGDYYNYTDSFARDYKTGNTTGNNIILNETLLLNGQPRITSRPKDYFNYVTPHQYLKYDMSNGLNFYSFCLYPPLVQPSGSCNMSQIISSQVQLQTSNVISVSNPGVFVAYGISHNILRISNGLGGLVFIK